MRHKRSGRRLADLHAACAVEGSVTRKGDELEVNVVLKNGTSGRPLWQHIYRRPVKEMPNLEAELTEALASKAVPKSREARANDRRPATIDPEAALLYLEARQNSTHTRRPGSGAASSFTSRPSSGNLTMRWLTRASR